MTPEEALKDIIESGIDLGAGDYVSVKALKVAVEALEKQIPKKLVLEHHVIENVVTKKQIPYSNVVCPSCGSDNIMCDYETIFNYCADCGQAIDWGE